MRILKTDNYISERIKVQPVTNAELDKLQNEMKDPSPRLMPLSNFLTVQMFEPGWIVFISDNEHQNLSEPRIVVPVYYAEEMFKCSLAPNKFIFVRVIEEEDVVYIQGKMFDRTFPKSSNGRFTIDKVYKWHIPDLENICRSKILFKEWYNKQNFDDLLK